MFLINFKEGGVLSPSEGWWYNPALPKKVLDTSFRLKYLRV
jgi:hypothetical protein